MLNKITQTPSCASFRDKVEDIIQGRAKSAFGRSMQLSRRAIPSALQVLLASVRIKSQAAIKPGELTTSFVISGKRSQPEDSST